MSEKKRYAVLNGEVVDRATGFKARGTFKIIKGSTFTTIKKYDPKKKDFVKVGRAGKMNKGVEKIAIKLQKKRQQKERREELKKYNKWKKDLESKSAYDQQREKLDKGDRSELKIEDVLDIDHLRRSSDKEIKVDRDTQELLNFSRLLHTLKTDGIITMDKIDYLYGDGRFNSVEEYCQYMYEKYRDSNDPDEKNLLWLELHSMHPDEVYTYDPLDQRYY